MREPTHAWCYICEDEGLIADGEVDIDYEGMMSFVCADCVKELAREWDIEKGTVVPEEITPGCSCNRHKAGGLIHVQYTHLCC